MREEPTERAGHPDRLRWNAKYAGGAGAGFTAHPLAARALAMAPAGPVLDLACGPSGAALLAAGHGRRVTAVDISDVALGLLGGEARRRGLGDLITIVEADLGEWRPAPGRYALVVCTGYWDRSLFGAAAGAVRPGGVLAWEAFTAEARRARPRLPAEWCLGPGEPAALLPAGFGVVLQEDLPDEERGTKRRLLAERRVPGGTAGWLRPSGRGEADCPAEQGRKGRIAVKAIRRLPGSRGLVLLFDVVVQDADRGAAHASGDVGA